MTDDRAARRRVLLTGAATAGLAGLGWYALRPPRDEHAGHAMPAEPAAREPAAGTTSIELAPITDRFTTALRGAGADGLWGVLDAASFKRVVARETRFAVLPGMPTTLWTYVVEANGKTFVNPTLRVRSGDRIAATLENRLPQPTVIHWHGLANDEANDGAGFKLAAARGGRYEYDFIVRDAARNAWYHTHAMGMAGEQANRGLAGLLLVEDETTDALARSLDLEFGVTDLPLVIQDRQLDAQGGFAYSRDKAAWFHGAIGDEILVNMTPRPAVDLPKRIVRLRILNGSNARSYRLAFSQGARALPYLIVGTDGGLLEAPIEVRETFLAAAQRLDVLIDLRVAQGDEPVFLRTLAFDPMHNEGAMQAAAGGAHAHHHHGGLLPEGADAPILQINVKAHEGYNGALPAKLRALPAIAIDAPERKFLLDHDGKGVWRINGKAHAMHDFSTRIKRGAKEVWTIENAAASMPHPMHVHAYSFALVDRKGTPEQVRGSGVDERGRLAADRGLLDTVLVWPGETVRIALDFSDPFSGVQRYMLHCHNLEHEDLGMMTNFVVA